VYDVQIRASAGETLKSDWTPLLSVTSHPQTAPGPLNVVVGATATGFDISWAPPTGLYTNSIIEYNILYWDKDTDCSYVTGAAFTNSPAHIDGLLPGHHYLVAPVTWNAAGEGFPEIVHSVTIGQGTPPPPSGLSIIANDPTTIHMTWAGSVVAAGYKLWSRNVNIANSVYQSAGTSDGTCVDVYFLFPGTWNYEWCISAYNGNAESPLGACVLAPSPVSGAATTTCPPPPAWCADGGGGFGGGSPTSPPGSGGTSTAAPAPTGAWPVVTNGQCRGPDCTNGLCAGPLCVSYGCSGTDCLNGVCTGLNCIVLGCIGSGCTNGVCTGAGCVTSGCYGPQCGSNGGCTGINCVSLGCVGTDCGSNGVCLGLDCWEHSCRGSNCANGGCTGTGCTGLDGCTGADCANGECTSPSCSSCSGPDCNNGDCTGVNCNGCSGSDCHNGQCTGPNCSGCTGSDCHNGQCLGPTCSSCAGTDCVCSGSKCGCKGPHCSGCSGLDCSCFGLTCGCHSPLCSSSFGLDCSCIGLTCGCTGPSCSGCSGSGCSCSGSGCSGGNNDNNQPSSCKVSSTLRNCGVGCSVTDYGDVSYATTCYTTTCSTVTTCGSVGVTTTTATTVSVCPLTAAPYSTWTPTDPNAPPLTLGSDNKYSSSTSSPPPPPLPPTTTTPLPYPTNTAINTGGALCFSDYNKNGQYAAFSQTDAQTVVALFCGRGYALGPGATFTYTDDYNGVKAEISWAANQSGCGAEQDLNLSNTGCLDAWDTDFFQCKSTCQPHFAKVCCALELTLLPLQTGSGGSTTANYGGAHVYNTLPNGLGGCILVSLNKPTATTKTIIQILGSSSASNQSSSIVVWRLSTSGNIHLQHLWPNSTVKI
jgi:hypothetical protein